MIKVMATSKQTKTKEYDTLSLITVASFAMPFIAWGFGAAVNPTGWMSSAEGLIYIPITQLLLVAQYWPAILLVALLLYLIATKHRKYLRIYLASVLIAYNALYSVVAYQIIATAEDSEFTG